MPRDYFVKYGGTAFQNNVAPEHIHDFVRQLPYEEKQSVYEVINRLENQGLISKIDMSNMM